LVATVVRGRFRDLSACVGAPGPHDFAVRCNIIRLARHLTCAPDAAASTASRTNVRDDRDTSLSWDGMESEYSCFYLAVKYNSENQKSDKASFSSVMARLSGRGRRQARHSLITELS